MLNLHDIIQYSSPLKLLYVEDDEIARTSTLSVLEEFFDDIVVAVDGQDGIEKYRQGCFDIIITDINMPRLSGLDMIEQIRIHNKEISVLILSAYNEADFFMDSIRLNVQGYLLKPIDTEQFLNVLYKIIEKIKLQEETSRNLHLIRQYQQITDKSFIVSKMDKDGILTYVNNEYRKIYSYDDNELIGKKYNIIRHPDSPDMLEKEIWDTIKNKKDTWHGIVRNQAKNGNTHYVKTTFKPIVDKDGSIIEFMGIHYDISDIMNPKKQLQDLVDSSEKNIVVIVKIESFDDIEKYYGHVLSQHIENKVANELLRFTPKECQFEKVYMLGDGEYAFAKEYQDSFSSESSIVAKLKKFQDNINDIDINIGDIDYDVSVVISFAYGKEAFDNAKYGLKELLRTNHDFIQASNLIEQERLSAEENIKTLKMVKKAIDNFRIVSYFQPIINNKTRKVEKYESLVRLIDENGNVLSPFFFLDVAKKGKYYSQITHLVLENSFNALKNTDMDISINLSALDIEKPLTRNKLHTLLQENKKDTHRIVFELLEDEDIKNFEVIKKFIRDIKSYGAKIAIDDFGAGYSNFKRLLDYQPDILKIDGSLIKNIETNTYSLSVVKTIVAFAKEQHIKIIAEYVENENIYNILYSLGVDYSQGYYFGKPVKL